MCELIGALLLSQALTRIGRQFYLNRRERDCCRNRADTLKQDHLKEAHIRQKNHKRGNGLTHAVDTEYQALARCLVSRQRTPPLSQKPVRLGRIWPDKTLE